MAVDDLKKLDGLVPQNFQLIDPTLEQNDSFNKIRQGTATNTFSKIKPANNKNTVINPITGDATITQGDISITITHYADLAGLKTSTHQLLDALVVTLTETGAREPEVEISLKDYMEKRKLKDRKEARKQAEADLETLFNAKITFTEKRKNSNDQPFRDVRIIEAKGIDDRGIISVRFASLYFQALKSYPVMPYPSLLWALSGKRNPNSYFFLRKIAEHKNMNMGKKNEDIIAVKTLLAIAPHIPSYQEVKKKDRAFTRKIIDPFERDMDALADALTWEFCHRNNTPLTDEELANLNYDTFINLLVHTTWTNYPDQTARLEKKRERIERATQKQKKKKK